MSNRDNKGNAVISGIAHPEAATAGLHRQAAGGHLTWSLLGVSEAARLREAPAPAEMGRMPMGACSQKAMLPVRLATWRSCEPMPMPMPMRASSPPSPLLLELSLLLPLSSPSEELAVSSSLSSPVAKQMTLS
jgi:hypothetical protein